MSDNDFFGGRRRRRAGAAFSPYSLFANGEQGVWYDPSDLTPEKVSWRRNLLTYSQDFENAAWTKSNASILSNLALYSQDFDNAAWQKTNVTVTANAVVAPDGTTTADKIEATTAAATTLLQNVGVINATSVTFSFYGKQGSGATDANKFDVYNVTTASDLAVFNVNWSTGVVTVTLGAASTTSTDVGNGWWRITATVTTGITSGNSLRVYPAFIGGTETANEFSYLWGAQLVPGSTAQTYTRSLATAAPVMFSDPLGGTLADKLVENTANANHVVNWATTLTSGTTYTLSVYAKAAERTFVAVQTSNVGNWAASVLTIFNLSNGTIQSGSGTITAIGDGWYRCAITATFGATSTTGGINVLPATVGSVTYLGDGTSGLYVYGAQVEQASTASAYQRITDFNSDFLAAFPTHALYQESTGVTPVTALGQSVGYVFDKRLGPMGDNLFGYSSWQTIGGWEATSNATLSVSSGQLVLHATGANASSGYRLTTVVGRQYQYRVRLAQDAMTGNSFMGVGSGGGSGWAANIASLNLGSTTGTYSITFTATSTDTRLSLFGSSSSVAGEILVWAEPMVREVPGNHALQATSAARPTLQARSNLLTRTEEFDNAAWTKTDATVTANATTAPDGQATADALVTSVASNPNVQLALTGPYTNVPLTFSFWAKAGTVSETLGQLFVNSGLPSGLVTVTGAILSGPGTLDTSGASSGTIRVTGLSSTEWTRIRITGTPTATSGNIAAYIKNRLTGSQIGDTTYIWGAQLELGSTATTYQRVVTATDYADVGLPRNLTFDGVDDSLATAGNVDFSATDKVTLFSGLFKASDAAQGIVTELTASAALNTGAFNIQAPSATPGTNRYAFESKGSVLATANVTNAIYAAPRTDVVTMQSAISTDALDGRINGTSVATSATDQGTGNFSNALVYIGRRGGSSLPFNGRLFQLVIRGAATDSVTVGNAERWVGQLTGVAL